MFKIVPLTREHLTALGVDRVPATIEGYALVDGERTLAAAGLYLADAHYVLASHIGDELRAQMRAHRHIRPMLAGARACIALARGRKLPIYAIADCEIYGSVNLLRHLNFVHVTQDIYEWHGSR